MEIYENVDDLFLDGEIFKDIEGYDGDYQVSNFGRIKSFKKWRGIDVRILTQIKDGGGYLRVKLYKNGKCKPKEIHRLLFETFNNYKLKKGEVVHHIDKNILNNDLNNFKLMTNSEHTILHKSGEKHPEISKKMSGENNPQVKLKEQDVIKIKESDLPQKELAEIFGVSQPTISLIKTGRIWKHIKI